MLEKRSKHTAEVAGLEGIMAQGGFNYPGAAAGN